MTEALQRAEIVNMTHDPQPMCLCDKFDESGAEYVVDFLLIDPKREAHRTTADFATLTIDPAMLDRQQQQH